MQLCRGIIPALESAHAVAYAMKLAAEVRLYKLNSDVP
jgi:tryptophan synthase beta subunit